jgi:hypothetical protein
MSGESGLCPVQYGHELDFAAVCLMKVAHLIGTGQRAALPMNELAGSTVNSALVRGDCTNPPRPDRRRTGSRLAQPRASAPVTASMVSPARNDTADAPSRSTAQPGD